MPHTDARRQQPPDRQRRQWLPGGESLRSPTQLECFEQLASLLPDFAESRGRRWVIGIQGGGTLEVPLSGLQVTGLERRDGPSHQHADVIRRRRRLRPGQWVRQSDKEQPSDRVYLHTGILDDGGTV